jgi:AGCS family alanine or glycine:cation symporter
VSLLLAFGLVFNAVQSNSISDALFTGFGVDKTLTGILVVAASGAVIFGGARRIGKVAEILVPVMAIAYLLVAVYAIVTHIAELPAVLVTIVTHAFSGEAALGGFAGSTMKQAAEMGIKRGVFSNEAGMGSAPNAAASASTPHPVNQGLLQMLGVFIDTIVICSATAFIILLSNAYVPGGAAKGAALTQAAVDFHIGSGGSAFMGIAVFLFAFTSIIGNYAYAESNINFIKNDRNLRMVFRLLVLGMVMFGATGDLPLVWDMADLSMGFMALINLVAILLLSKFSLAAWKDYSSQLKAGIADPVFKSKSIDGLSEKLSDNAWK